ncbi:MAG: GDSL-type esterase/lipase family protein [Clostridia bacterium]|nr:GDSL-type esterase/lipase family protein [Clostridia bacterium]
MMNRYDPLGEGFLRLGRCDAGEQVCRLWWSGSGVRTKVCCDRLEAEFFVPEADAHAPWVAVTLDGAPVARIPLAPGRRRYDLLGRLGAEAAHEVAILRDSQPTDSDSGPLELLAVYTDGVPEAPAPRERLIEFLGDSLTVGEGTLGPVSAQEWRTALISSQFAYPTLVSERMNAEKRVIALGGWGAHVSFDRNYEHTLGHIYDSLCAVVPGGEAAYDFEAQRPADAVVINLGTNDFSGMSKVHTPPTGEQLAAFTGSAEALLDQLRRRNPGAMLLWAYGLCGSSLKGPIRQAVEARRAAGDEKVAFLALTDCGDDHGSRSHPSRRAHRRAALEIAAALEEFLN